MPDIAAIGEPRATAVIRCDSCPFMDGCDGDYCWREDNAL